MYYRLGTQTLEYVRCVQSSDDWMQNCLSYQAIDDAFGGDRHAAHCLYSIADTVHCLRKANVASLSLVPATKHRKHHKHCEAPRSTAKHHKACKSETLSIMPPDSPNRSDEFAIRLN